LTLSDDEEKLMEGRIPGFAGEEIFCPLCGRNGKEVEIVMGDFSEVPNFVCLYCDIRFEVEEYENNA